MDAQPNRDAALPPTLAPTQRAEVLIVGGGAAGITVAAELRRHRPGLAVTLIEPAETHAYQPGWTLVGAGVFSLAETLRPEASLIPRGVAWIRGTVTGFHPEVNQVALADGRRIAYRQLVVCLGLQLDWDKVEGLRQALGSQGVCSNYAAETVE